LPAGSRRTECPVWWCDGDGPAHQWQSNGPGRTRLHSHRMQTVQVVQSENDPGPWAKVTVHVDVDEMDRAESARVMAQDLTAAAVLLKRIAVRSSC
jgi:hypothetical protein